MPTLCPSCLTPIESPLTGRERWACPHCGKEFAGNEEPTLAANSADTHRDGRIAESLALLSIGRFQILGELGRGTFGTVYRAFDTELQRSVALKVPRGAEFTSTADRQRFLREARSASQLHHPAIVRVFDMGESNGLPYIVGELVEGSSLDKLVAARRFSFREAAEIVAAVAEGLQSAHQSGVVHRDIKPSNIMIDADGKPRIMDFGLARQEQRDATLTQAGDILGTPAYMSPEQAAGRSHGGDHRSDIYSLAVVLYELLTHERPFRGNAPMVMQQVLNDDPDNPRSLNNYIPVDLETICLKAIDKEPDRRYQTAQELADELRRWLRSEPIHARRIGRTGRAFRWCRRNPSTAAAMAILLLAVIGATTAAIWIRDVTTREKVARAEKQAADTQAQLADLEAKRSGEDAHRAVEQYYTAITANPLLEDPTAQPLLREIQSTAVDYCQKFLAEFGKRPDLAAEVAATYVRLAQLQLANGDTDTATATMGQAASRLEKLLAAHPALEQLRPLAVGLFHFPRYAQRRGAVGPTDPNGPLNVMNHCLAIWDRLVTDYPGVANFEHDRAGMYYYANLAHRAVQDWPRASHDIETSIAILTRLIEREPQNTGYKRELSLFCSVYGEYYAQHFADLANALKWEERAVTIDPSDARPYDQMARMLANHPNPKLRKPSQAVQLAKKATDIEPRNPQFWNTLGLAQYRAGNWQAALDAFDRSMMLGNGGDGLDWYFVACAHARLGNRDRAAEFFQKAERWKQKQKMTSGDLERTSHEAQSVVGTALKRPASDQPTVLHEKRP